MELLSIGDVWNGFSEIPWQDLTDAPSIVKCVKVDEELIVIGMCHRSLGLCFHLPVLSAGIINCVPALPAFTVVLSIKYERDIL